MGKLIIFDYDGVIVDSFPTVHKVYQSICQTLGKQCPNDISEFRKIYGVSSRNLMKNLNFSPEEIRKVDKIYQEEIIKHEPSFFPQVDEVIRQLQEKHKLILVSSSPYKEVTEKLAKLGIIELFKDIKAGEKLGPMKKPEVLKMIIQQEKVNPNDVIMIGDRINDYNDAQKAGITKIIIVEYGWGYDKDKIPKQKITVHQPSDLLKAVNELEK